MPPPPLQKCGRRRRTGSTPTLPRAQVNNSQASSERGNCAPSRKEHGGEHWNCIKSGSPPRGAREKHPVRGAQGQAPEDPRAPACLADTVPEHQDCTLREMAGAPVERVWGLSPRTVRVSREPSSTCRGCASAPSTQLGERWGSAGLGEDLQPSEDRGGSLCLPRRVWLQRQHVKREGHAGVSETPECYVPSRARASLCRLP